MAEAERTHWFGKPASAYVALIPLLVKAAKEVGYGLAVHGSLNFDLDLVAVPWSEKAVTNPTLIDTLCDAIALDQLHRKAITGPTRKPHGRQAWVIPLGSGLAIDISVLPLRRKE